MNTASISAPRYTISEGARLARTSPQNVRRWLLGYRAPGHKMEPVLGERAKSDTQLLSFLDVCELGVVAAYRKDPGAVPLERLRQAYDFASRNLGLEHPFASERLRREGGHVLYEFSREHPGPGVLVLDLHGQYVLPDAVSGVIAQFEFGAADHLAHRWYLLGRQIPVVIDPERGSGMPTVDGRNLRADFLTGRWKAGESIAELAEDYELEASVVEAALRAAA